MEYSYINLTPNVVFISNPNLTSCVDTSLFDNQGLYIPTSIVHL